MSGDTATSVLRAPFPPEIVGKLPRVTCQACSKKACHEHQKKRCDVCGSYISEKHIHLDFVGHADVTSRLLDADPGWSWEPFAVDDRGLPLCDVDDRGNPVGLWMRLTVAGVTRIGYGSCPSDQGDAVKVLIGDALRNAAMRFGVAVDLWAKGDRTDPSTENATGAAGQANRARPAPKPAVTDLAWMERFDADIATAASVKALDDLATEAKRKYQAAELSREDAELLRAALDQRRKELTAA